MLQVICIILHAATIAVISALATAKTTIKTKTTATTENNNNNNNDNNNNDGETYGCISFMYSTGHHTCTTHTDHITLCVQYGI